MRQNVAFIYTLSDLCLSLAHFLAGRLPAGLCGCVGFKGTLGSVSTVGVVPACASLDCLTVFARSVQDGKQLVRIMRSASADLDVWRRVPLQVRAFCDCLLALLSCVCIHSSVIDDQSALLLPVLVSQISSDCSSFVLAPLQLPPPPMASFRFAVPSQSLLDWKCPGGPQAERACQEQFAAAVARMQAIGGTLVSQGLRLHACVCSCAHNCRAVHSSWLMNAFWA